MAIQHPGSVEGVLEGNGTRLDSHGGEGIFRGEGHTQERLLVVMSFLMRKRDS